MNEQLVGRFVRWLDSGTEYFEIAEALNEAHARILKKEEKIKETAQAIAKLYPDYNLTEEEYMQIANTVYDTVKDVSEPEKSYLEKDSYSLFWFVF